ncbi:MAG: Flp family type IVb pilin [Eubacteriales bacterium]
MLKLKTILADEDGQSIVEYGLLIGLIVLVAIVALMAMAPKVVNLYELANNELPS